MEIYDQHVHTEFSHDSKTPYESYLKALQEMGKTTFVTTEHLDLDHITNKCNEIPDFARQKELIAMAKQPLFNRDFQRQLQCSKKLVSILLCNLKIESVTW